MESEKYLEGQSMQRLPLFESDGFIYWKNRFETYVKSKDLDLWHVITDGDFPPIPNNPKTKKNEIVPFHKQNDNLKKKLAKNNEAKMDLTGVNSDEDEEEKTKDEKCLMAKASNEGPYCTDLPTLDDIRQLIELERVVVDRTIKSQMVALNPNQILTKELSLDMKQWEELIRENVFGLGGHRDRLPACLAHMLYCVVAEEQYNLAYFFVKRIECAKAIPTANLPYGMFLTHLYRYVMETYPHLDNDTYDIVERVIRTSSHQHDDDDDDDDVETSRASTPSPTTYLNSLHPLDYQNYHIPSSSKQTDETLFARQTTLLNQTQ
ncbi:hypothetical protein Tco_0441913 [Tanacetum coccineum]